MKQRNDKVWERAEDAKASISKAESEERKVAVARLHDLANIAEAADKIEEAFANLRAGQAITYDRDTFRYYQNLMEKLEEPRRELQFLYERVTRREANKTLRVTI